MKRDVVKEIIKDDRKLVIYQDDDAESPDRWGDGSLYLVHDHRQFAVRQKEARSIYDYLQSQNPDNREEGEDRETGYDGFWIFPVAAYIHSGVSLSLGSGSHYPDQRWDVSHVGFVVVSKEEWAEKDKARKVAEGLIETWNEYLSGEVYGYRTFNKNESYKISKVDFVACVDDNSPGDLADKIIEAAETVVEWEEEDSCWGFYGDGGIEQIISETGFEEEKEVAK